MAGFVKSAMTLFCVLTLFSTYVTSGYRQNIFDFSSYTVDEDSPETAPLGHSVEEGDAELPPVGMSGAMQPQLGGIYALNEAVVKNFAELSDALSKDNGITVVHLGNNIVMTAGIRIHHNKSNVVIDGIDPSNISQKEPFTLTDLNLLSLYSAVYIDSQGVKSLHVKDMKIIGKNFYGPFSVLDAPILAGTELIFERVNYDGPQLGYHRQGSIRFIDCTAKIHGGNGLGEAQEFAETKNITFEGKNNIISYTTLHSVFWQPGGGNFTVAADSSVTLVSPNTYRLEGIFYAGLRANKINVTVGQNAVLDITASAMLAPATYGMLSGVTIKRGGAFYVTGTATPPEALLTVNGNITVESNSAFVVNLNSGGAVPVSVISGDVNIGKDAVFHIITGSDSPAALELSGHSLVCDDPSSVILYNPDERDILASSSAASVSIGAEQINYWNAASPGGLDNPPKYGWRKADGSNITINAALSTGENGATSNIVSNYALNETPTPIPNATTFSMTAARVLAFGRLELIVEAPAAYAGHITGVTAPGAAVRASFQGGAPMDVIADMDGVFTIETGIPLPPGTEITVNSAYRYLTAKSTVIVDAGGGGINFAVPEELKFQTSELSARTQTVKRLNPAWHIVVSDTRLNSGEWRVYAREVSPLTPDDALKPPLEKALVFVGEDGLTTPLGGEVAQEIYRHDADSQVETVSIHWNQDKGILVRVPTGAAYSGVLYTGVVEWTLIDAP